MTPNYQLKWAQGQSKEVHLVSGSWRSRKRWNYVLRSFCPHHNKAWLGWLQSQAASSSGLVAFQLSGPQRELLLVSRYSKKPRTLFIPNSELRAGEGKHKKGSPGRWEQLWGQETGWVSIPHAPARQAGRGTGWVLVGIWAIFTGMWEMLLSEPNTDIHNCL